MQIQNRLFSLFFLFTILAATTTVSGCATAYSKAQYFSIGEFNPKGNEAVEKEYRRIQEDPPAEAAKIKVLFETVPEGVKYENGSVSVEKGYPLQIIGKFTLFAPNGNPIWFSDYKSTGRKALCYWQVPLTWVTLGLWAMVPTSYPCWARGFKTQEEWIDHLRLLAHAAKGNMVVAMRGHGANAEGFIFQAEPEYLEAMSKPKIDHSKKPSDVAKRQGTGPDV